MWTKRIELGRFRFQSEGDDAVNVRAIESAELTLILQGIDLQGARRRPRWLPRSPRNAMSVSFKWSPRPARRLAP